MPPRRSARARRKAAKDSAQQSSSRSSDKASKQAFGDENADPTQTPAAPAAVRKQRQTLSTRSNNPPVATAELSEEITPNLSKLSPSRSPLQPPPAPHSEPLDAISPAPLRQTRATRAAPPVAEVELSTAEEVDEITPNPPQSVVLPQSPEPVLEDVDEITPKHPPATGSPAPPHFDPPTSMNPPAPSSASSRAPHPFRPLPPTYGKRRRLRSRPVPSMRDLGVVREASSSEDGGGSPLHIDDAGDVEVAEEEHVIRNDRPREKELAEFMEHQRQLWAEVDHVDLEEDFD